LDLVAGATFTVVAACFPFSLFELNVGQFLCMSLQAVGLSASEPEKDSLSFSFFQRLGGSMLIRSGPDPDGWTDNQTENTNSVAIA